MKGGIYSDQRCPLCGEKFKDNRISGMFCPNHQEQKASSFVVRFGSLTKRFESYHEAFRFLTGVRYETDLGKFDPRDYRRDNPLGFANRVQAFLHSKRHRRGVGKYEQRLRFGVQRWQNRNVKEIGYADLESLKNDLEDRGLSSKYLYDIFSCLKTFWMWLTRLGPKKGGIPREDMPDFPEVESHMAYRKIVRKEVQSRILEQIRQRTWTLNPRIYIGCLFLATYTKLRPWELRNIKEKHVDLENGYVLIPHPKEKEPKLIPLLDEDVQLLRSMPRGFPEMFLFRHGQGNGAAKPGQQFGKDYLYKQWQLACEDLKVEGVSLYPGTRHSSVTAMRDSHSKEDCKAAAGSRSNKAFDRYLQEPLKKLRELYQEARSDNALITLPGVQTKQKTQ